MSLTFPRALPNLRVSGCKLDIQRVDFLSPTNTARIAGVAAGFPLWTLDLQADPNLEIDTATWRAWINAQRGPLRQFYARDMTRSLPLLYWAGLPGGWSGDAASWSQAIDGAGQCVVTLNLGGARAGFVLSPDDLIGFRWSDHSRALVRCVEGATANGSGVVAVSVEPSVPVVSVAGGVVPTDGSAIAYLNAPTCLMRLDSKSSGVSAIGNTRTAQVKISAVQDLIP